jgi:hypothetical protein
MNTTDELIDLSAIYLSVCLKMNVKELIDAVFICGFRMVFTDTDDVC